MPSTLESTLRGLELHLLLPKKVRQKNTHKRRGREVQTWKTYFGLSSTKLLLSPPYITPQESPLSVREEGETLACQNSQSAIEHEHSLQDTHQLTPIFYDPLPVFGVSSSHRQEAFDQFSNHQLLDLLQNTALATQCFYQGHDNSKFIGFFSLLDEIMHAKCLVQSRTSPDNSYFLLWLFAVCVVR